MSITRYRPHLVLLMLLAVTSLALVFGVSVSVVDDVAIQTELPEQVGEWRSEDVFFCHNEKCQKGFPATQLAGRTDCPVCGGELRQTWSFGESWLLPADTTLLRKVYTHPSGRQLTVSIVVNGREQVSIHRPEICLVAQGNEVARRFTTAVPLAGRPPLNVRNLDLFRRLQAQNGEIVEQASSYTYWFVGGGRETESHYLRMTYMAMDRLIFGKAYRWAYVTVSGPRVSGSGSHQQQVHEFIQTFYPLIMKSRGP